ncbi:MAG: amino acid ABC transporter ATP-binding protein, partial [Lachnospiraceae bacterium]
MDVLKNMNFHAPKGKTTAIIGPSGAGKSTLLRSINMLEIPDKGSITVANDEIRFEGNKHHQREIIAIRRHTGMVFQGFNLFPHKTILENIIEGPVQVGRQNPKEARLMAEELLEKVDLLDKKDSYPSTLSGGQQQRAAIARAMSMKPEILLFDEPTSALDPELEREVLKVIRTLVEENNTMIIVTHNLLFAKEVADIVVFLYEGQVAASGAPKDIFGGKTVKRVDEFISAMLPPIEYN